jgi:hypothetical protein
MIGDKPLPKPSAKKWDGCSSMNFTLGSRLTEKAGSITSTFSVGVIFMD